MPAYPKSAHESTPPWSSGARRLFRWNLAWLALLWADVFWTLHHEWEVNQQYSYGFIMPFLGLYLLYLRWEDRPRVEPCQKARSVWWAPGLVAMLMLVPFRILFQANPDWRLLMWAHALGVWALSLGLLFCFGGGKWLRHFAPAFTFFLLAVPWPSMVEIPLVQGLMRMVAQVSVEVINLLGINAVQMGNLIRLPRGMVGVEEACSGVRSFQSAIMAGFFFSEWFRFRIGYRVVLIAVGMALSIFLNLLRTLTLTLVTHFEGGEAMTRWHDPVGYFVYFGSFGLIFLVGRLLLRRARMPRNEVLPGGKFLRGDAGGLLRRGWIVAFLACWAASIGIAEAYYRLGRSERRFVVAVEPDLDKVQAPVRFPEIPEQTRAILRYSEGLMATWRRQNASWTYYFFEWDAGEVSSFAGVHRPEICLQAAGLRLAARHEPLVWTRSPFEMVLETYTFRAGDRDYFVFFAVWENVNGRNIVVNPDPGDRLANVRSRIRGGARQSLEIVVTGLPSMAVARDEVQAVLDRTLELAIARP